MESKNFRNFDIFGLETGYYSKGEDSPHLNSEFAGKSSQDKDLKKKVREKQRKKFGHPQKKDHLTLGINLSPGGYLNGPDHISIANSFGGGSKLITGDIDSKKPSSSLKDNDGLMLSFNPQCKIPIKDLVVKLTLKNSANNDIRVYDLNMTINPKVIKFSLEMVTNARVPIIQDLPVPNSNIFDVIIKPAFEIIEGDRNYFDLNLKPFKVKKKTVANYHLRFNSMWISKCKGRLTLVNNTTNEKTVYEVEAVSKKPLSEDHIKLTANIGELTTLKIPLENKSSKLIEYTVECEIPNAQFDKRVTLKPSAKVNFQILFTKSVSGEFPFVIKFI